jgi:hypothetical protein
MTGGSALTRDLQVAMLTEKALGGRGATITSMQVAVDHHVLV